MLQTAQAARNVGTRGLLRAGEPLGDRVVGEILDDAELHSLPALLRQLGECIVESRAERLEIRGPVDPVAVFLGERGRSPSELLERSPLDCSGAVVGGELVARDAEHPRFGFGRPGSAAARPALERNGPALRPELDCRVRVTKTTGEVNQQPFLEAVVERLERGLVVAYALRRLHQGLKWYSGPAL